MVTKGLLRDWEPMGRARGRLRGLSLFLVFAGCVLFAVRGYRDQQTTLQSFDFKPVYSGARCLLDGCDPYDSAAIEREFLAHGGPADDLRPFRPFNANYPPSALALVAPFALLPFGPAHLLWLGLSACIFSVAALLIGEFCFELLAVGGGPGVVLVAVALLLAGFVATSTMLLMLAQPAGVALGLLGIGVWCLLRGRFAVVGVVAFALSLTLKPHLGALLWLFFLIARKASVATGQTAEPALRYRRRALEIGVLAVAFSLPGVVWASVQPASSQWPAELRRNLAGIAAHGNASDPGPANDEAHDITNLQAVFSVLRDEPRFYNELSLAISGALFLLWAVALVRAEPSWRRDLLGLAAAAGLTLLPLYHRQYDTRLLLLTFPALGYLLASRGGLRWVALALTAVGTVVTTHNFPHWMARLHPGATGKMATLLCFRAMPLFLLVLTSFYLVCLLRGAEHERS